MEPFATPAPGIAATRAVELATQASLALMRGNVTEAYQRSQTAQLLFRKRTTTFLPETAAFILFVNGRCLHAKALLLQRTVERNAEIQFSMMQSPGLLRIAGSRLRQAREILSESPNSDPLLIAHIQSTRGLLRYDVSLQRGRYHRSGRTERMNRRKRAKLRQQGLNEMRAAVEQLRANPQPATYQSLEVYLNLISCCGLFEKSSLIIEAIEQCESLGIPRMYALDGLMGRQSTISVLTKFYKKHTLEHVAEPPLMALPPKG